MKYNLRRQDIHLKDRPLWENIKESWQQKNYSEAIKEVKSSQLKTKASVASSLNEIVDYLEKVQNIEKIKLWLTIYCSFAFE